VDSENLSFLQAADIFSVLDPDEFDDLSQGLQVTELVAEQASVTQGDAGSSLFIVVSGHLAVFITDAGTPVHVGDLYEGDFFGEMSLLTGTPRTATVRATLPTSVIEITKSRLAPLMQRHAELASMMGLALSERQSSNLKTLMEFEHPATETEQETVAAQLSYRISKFFELPVTVWGKAVDGISGFSFSGPLAYVLGRTDETASAGRPSAGSDDRQIAFTTAIIVIAAKMAAAGGSYSEREVGLLQEIFDIPAGDMANVRRIYNRAQGSPKGYEPFAEQIAELFKDRTTVLEELIGMLLKVAGSGTPGTEYKLRVIERVSVIFGFSSEEFERLQTINAQSTSAASGEETMDYLSVLSLPLNTTPEEAKQAYRRLVMENHPDKLIAEGMPEEFIKQANEKLAMINTAYEQFRAAHAVA